MNSRATAQFWRRFNGLSGTAQRYAENAYRLWIANPYHRSLEFKKIDPERPIYSVRIGLHWRAIGIRDNETVIWFWIGSHAEYDNFLKRL